MIQFKDMVLRTRVPDIAPAAFEGRIVEYKETRSRNPVLYDSTPGFGWMVFGIMDFLALFRLYGQWSIIF